MFPYLLLSTFSGFGSVLYQRKYDLLISDFIFFILLILVCFRGGGFGLADYDNYKDFYDLVVSWQDVLLESVPAEIGFRFFCFLGNSLGFSSQFIIMIMGVFSTLPVYYFIRKYACYKILAIFFWLPYFYTFNMQTSRTSVAVAFGLIFIFYFFKKKYLWSIFALLMAVSFHTAALILILVFLTLFPVNVLFYFTLSTFLFLIVISPVDLTISILDKIGKSNLSNAIILYRGGEFGYPLALYDPRIIVSLCVSYFGLKIKNTLSSFELYYLKLFIIGSFLLIAFSDVVILAWRFSYFFLICGVVIIPTIARYYNLKVFYELKAKLIFSLFVVFSYGIYQGWLIYNAEPFKFYFI